MATQYPRVPPEAASLPQDSLESESTTSLLRRLMDEVARLFRQEAALATAEVSRALTKAILGTVSIATGGAVLFSGFLVLLASAVLGLATVMEPWLAALIVGVVVGVIGYVMVHAGMKKLDVNDLKPTRSPESLRRDKEVLTRSAS